MQGGLGGEIVEIVNVYGDFEMIEPFHDHEENGVSKRERKCFVM